MKTQLLCTFAHKRDLELVADYVAKSYIVSEKRLFVFEDVDSRADLYVTYNVEPDDYGKTPNNGVLDKKFIINWPIYENSLMLNDGNDVRHIHLNLYKRIDL